MNRCCDQKGASPTRGAERKPPLEGWLGEGPQDWPEGEVRPVPLEQLDPGLARYRLAPTPAEQQQMLGSLRRYGQLSPVTVVWQQERLLLIDGFRRLLAARQAPSLSRLLARRIEVDASGAKAAMLLLNQVGRRASEWEQAWIVQALVREDGLSQQQAAQLLGRHKSWVHRRLAMLERLVPAVLEELHWGLLSASMARQLIRLPAGNQLAALAAARRESLTAGELKGLVDLLLASGARPQEEYVLSKPREALQQAQGVVTPCWDARLSSEGNRMNRRLASLLDQLSRMENWLSHHSRSQLALCDRKLLAGAFAKLARQSQQVAQLVEDFLPELQDS